MTKKDKQGLQEIPLKYIIANRRENPRKKKDNGAFNDLKSSIQQRGIVVPVIVRPVADQLDNHFELVCGFRRFRAATELKLESIPVIIRELDDQQAAEIRTIENLQREDLDILDEAEGFKKLLTDFDWKVEDIAERVGKSKIYVQKRIALLKTPDFIQKAVTENEITLGHAMLLRNIQDPKEQKQMLGWIVDRHWSVKQTCRNFDDNQRKINKDTPFNISKCKDCKWYGPNQKELPLDELGKKAKMGNVCFNKSCFEKKKQEAFEKIINEAKKKGLKVEQTNWSWDHRWKVFKGKLKEKLMDPEKCKDCPEHVMAFGEKYGGGQELTEICKKGSCKNWKDALEQSKEDKQERERMKKEREELNALANEVIEKIEPDFVNLLVLIREIEIIRISKEFKPITKRLIQQFSLDENILKEEIWKRGNLLIEEIKNQKPELYPEMIKIFRVLSLRYSAPTELKNLAKQIKKATLAKKIKKDMVKKQDPEKRSKQKRTK